VRSTAEVDTGLRPSSEGERDFAGLSRSPPDAGSRRDCTLWISEDAGSEIAQLELWETSKRRQELANLGAYQPLTIGDDTAGRRLYLYYQCRPLFFRLRTAHFGSRATEALRSTSVKDVWIGCHVPILPAATIGDGAIVGAGAGRDEIDSCGRDLGRWSPARRIGREHHPDETGGSFRMCRGYRWLLRGGVGAETVWYLAALQALSART